MRFDNMALRPDQCWREPRAPAGAPGPSAGRRGILTRTPRRDPDGPGEEAPCEVRRGSVGAEVKEYGSEGGDGMKLRRLFRYSV